MASAPSVVFPEARRRPPLVQELAVALVQALVVVVVVEPHPRSILRSGPCTVRQK